MHNIGKHVKAKAGASVFNWIRIAAAFTFAAAIIVSAYVIKTNRKYKELRDAYDEISESYTSVKSEEATPAAASVQDDSRDDYKSPFPIDIDFQSLLGKDSNIVGWIYAEDTMINYPVFHGTDNEFYLTNGMNGQYTGYGGIFLDAGNSGDFSNSNSILYGHHMQDGSFFASIYKYINQDYYEEHPVFWLGTPAQNYRADVYSCYVTPADSEAYTIRFSDINHFNNFVNNTVNNSLIKTEVMPNIGSKILTLSTCSYEYDNARCVVHCILTPV